MTKLTGRGLGMMMVRCAKINNSSESTAVPDTNTSNNLHSDTNNMNGTGTFPPNITNRTQIIQLENNITAVTKGSFNDNHTMTSYGNLTTKAVSDSKGLMEMSTVRCDLGNITCQHINDNLTTKINISLQQLTRATDIEKEKNNYVNSTRNNTFAGKQLDHCETLMNVTTDIFLLNNNKTIETFETNKIDNQTLEIYKYTHYYNCNNLHENMPANNKPSSSWSSVVRNFFILVVCILAGVCARHVIRYRQRKRNVYLYGHARIPVVCQL